MFGMGITKVKKAKIEPYFQELKSLEKSMFLRKPTLCEWFDLEEKLQSGYTIESKEIRLTGWLKGHLFETPKLNGIFKEFAPETVNELPREGILRIMKT